MARQLTRLRVASGRIVVRPVRRDARSRVDGGVGRPIAVASAMHRGDLLGDRLAHGLCECVCVCVVLCCVVLCCAVCDVCDVCDARDARDVRDVRNVRDWCGV